MDLGYEKESDGSTKNKGKRGRDEVRIRGKCSQNKRALVQTETRGHVQEASQGQLHHSVGSFCLISLFPAQCVTPLPTMPRVSQVWSLSGSFFFSLKYLLSLPGVGDRKEWRFFI